MEIIINEEELRRLILAHLRILFCERTITAEEITFHTGEDRVETHIQFKGDI